MEFILNRDVFAPEFTLGQLVLDGRHYGFTCEDTDRKMESGGTKVYGKTAIPRGRYRLSATLSNRFKRIMPQIMEVPGFEGIRIHGGNTAADTEGCPLLGLQRTFNGVMSCAAVNTSLVKLIQEAESQGKLCWITVQ